MCVIAGYVGSQDAAPVLVGMLRSQQGMGGGYYTGIVTVHGGQLHYRKVLGDVDTLLQRTDAARLPGTLGIAHSRSMGGGDDAWAHPFVDAGEQLAYVANGSVGSFEDRVDLAAAGNGVLDRGVAFRTATADAISGYPLLRDGSCVHMSEIMAHEISRCLGQCGDLTEALARAYRALPSELVGLCVHARHADQISACRLNMPLILGRDTTGTYTATTALAFPETVDWVLAVPPNSAATLDQDGARLLRLTDPPAPVAPIVSMEAVARIIGDELRGKGARTFSELSGAACALWPAGALGQPGMAVFQALSGWRDEGRVRYDESRVPGQYGRGSVPLTRFHWCGDGGAAAVPERSA